MMLPPPRSPSRLSLGQPRLAVAVRAEAQGVELVLVAAAHDAEAAQAVVDRPVWQRRLAPGLARRLARLPAGPRGGRLRPEAAEVVRLAPRDRPLQRQPEREAHVLR